MDGWTVTFILVFGIAGLIPAVWSIVGVIRGKSSFWPAVVGTIWAAVLMIFFFSAMAGEWARCDVQSAGSAVQCESCASDPWIEQCGARSKDGLAACVDVAAGSYCPTGERPVYDFCEKFADGLIKQPWSTWSDLSFIAAGLWILWWFGFFNSGTTINPMRDTSWLSMTYAMIVIFMGPPSMLLHASMENWGGWFDSMSVVVWLSFNAAYVIHMVFGAAFHETQRDAARTLWVLISTAIFVAVFGIVAWFEPDARLAGYFIGGGLWGIFEVVYLFRMLSSKKKYERNHWIFGANFLTLAVTMTIWVFWNAGIVDAVDCQAREDFPGHALFHILASFATVLTILSFASEKRVEG